MNSNESPIALATRLLLRYHWRWITPFVCVCGAAVAWTYLRQPTWQAHQGLMVRNVTSLDDRDLGQFPDGEARKIAQEMVLELSRRPEVLDRALVEVGPPANQPFVNGKPTVKHRAALEEAVKVGAPKGAELGRTDLIYLSVKDHSPNRAKQLAAAITKAVDQELRQLRRQQARSLVNELQEVVAVAESDLASASAQLIRLEQEAGADLAELRILTQTASGEGLLRQLLLSVDNDRRNLEVQLEQQKHLLAFLQASQDAPDAILSAPNALFEVQPSLRTLKQGLTSAQLTVAQLKGQYTASHPKVQAAIIAEEEVRGRLRNSLRDTTDALAEDVKVNEARLAVLEQRRAAIQQRADRISRLRAPYDASLENVRQATQVVQEAREQLAEARARLQAAETASLITLVGGPTTGDKPAGPRKAIVLLAGLFGGLCFGFGSLLLTVPPAEFTGRPQTTPVVAPPGHTQTHVRQPPTDSAADAPSQPTQESPASSTVVVGTDYDLLTSPPGVGTP